MLIVKLLGEKTSRAAWMNRELLQKLRRKKKKRFYELWKKGQGNQEDHRAVVKLCRKEIKRAKTRLELHLASAVRDKKKKKFFYKYINSNRRSKKNLRPLQDVRRNVVMKDEDKAEVLNGFFAFVFIREVNCSQGTQTSELEDGDQECDEAPVIQHEKACLVRQLPAKGLTAALIFPAGFCFGSPLDPTRCLLCVETCMGRKVLCAQMWAKTMELLRTQSSLLHPYPTHGS